MGKFDFNECLGRRKNGHHFRQTTDTRNQIRGILTSDNYQMIFIDTPGIHKPRHKLGEKMVQLSLRTLREVDLILFLTDAAAGPVLVMNM